MAQKLPTLVIEKDQKPPKLGQCYRAFLYFNGYWKLNHDYTYLIEMYSSANHRIDITSEGAARFQDMAQGFYFLENLRIDNSTSATLVSDENGVFQIYKIELERNCQICPVNIIGRSPNEPKIMPKTIQLSTTKLSDAYMKMCDLSSHIDEVKKLIEKIKKTQGIEMIHTSHLSVEIYERIMVGFNFFQLKIICL